MARIEIVQVVVVVVLLLVLPLLLLLLLLLRLRALYVFDDPLFWLSRNWRSKKILQNAVLRKRANLKKGQSSESGFFAFFSHYHDGKTQNHCPTQCFGLRVRFSKHAFSTQLRMAEKQKVLQNTAFLQQSNFA